MSFDILQQVFQKANPAKLYRHNHYWIYTAKKNSLEFLKIISIGDLREAGYPEGTYLNIFMKDSGACLMFPLSFMGFLCGFGFRAIEDKSFTIACFKPFMAYSSNKMVEEYHAGNVVYGLPILLSEGVMDAESLSEIYPLSVAYLGSSVSLGLCEIISHFTNRVIVVPDSDEAGERGYWATQKNLSRYGVQCNRVGMMFGYKDAGEFLKKQSMGEDVGEGFSLMKAKIGRLLVS
jgi:hypothetical protein